MKLLSLFRTLLKRITRSRLPTRNLTWMYGRVRYYLPDLNEDMAFILAAKLYMQNYTETNKIKLSDIVGAYKLATLGFCGTALNQMERHDHELSQDQTSKLIRWVMQMEFLILSADLKSASPTVLVDLLIQSKAAIRNDVEKTLNKRQASNSKQKGYDQTIQRFSQSPTYDKELADISFAIQVQSETD